jgi:two-component system sensor histidine kinase HydH
MHPGDWLRLVAITGLLVVAALSVVRSAGSLARILALLATDIGGMNVASLANHVTGADVGLLGDAVFTAMAPPLMLHFVASFVRAGRWTKAVIAGAYAAFGGLAIASFIASRRDASQWIEAPAWSVLFIAGAVPTLLLALALLLRHLRTTIDPHEKVRSRLLLAAFLVGGTLNTADVVTAATGQASHDVGSLGTLVAVVLVAVVVFRLRLFDRDLSTSTWLYAGAMAVATVALYLIVFWALSDRVAPLVLGTTCVTLLAGIGVRELVDSISRTRAQRDRLAVLGRFAAQMAHDVKNPLAAIVGAAHLAEDTAVSEEQRSFLRLILDQARRIAGIIDKYDRLGRVEPVLASTNLVDVVRRVVSAQTLAAPGIRFSVASDDDQVYAPIDEDLIAGALENVVRNAIEAMPTGGTLVLRVAVRNGHVVLHVEDDGEGMDARRVERAFEDFYTTKPSGSGLGLAFVRRVALAHGGDVSMTSRRGKGTVVELRLPTTDTESRDLVPPR